MALAAAAFLTGRFKLAFLVIAAVFWPLTALYVDWMSEERKL